MESPTEDLEFLDREGYLEVRALGAYSLARMKSQMERAAAACVERKAGRLLFDITAVREYTPSTAERFQIGSHLAQLIGTLARFACLANRDQIDRENFTSRVASNRGRPAPVFNDRQQALAWILEPPPPAP
ncbi:MAG: hypothetical protein HY293_10180 [Planctomycetes bacterium]|nr:hypothetical protein [Planctomycetota bacterium]